jgi:hypothetical protein
MCCSLLETLCSSSKEIPVNLILFEKGLDLFLLWWNYFSDRCYTTGGNGSALPIDVGNG